jgi:hypothetical protein
MKRDIMVKINDTIHRAKVWGDVEHPSSEWMMVEFYLPVNGFKTQWVRTCNVKAAHYMQLEWDMQMAQKNCIAISFLKKHHFPIPSQTIVDVWGFCYLNEDQQAKFWKKFKDG